ncbi:MAG: ABC-F family ATP-binding cassette domain-containing protein, partial [Oscillospiraceae bacterium]|nr:ABC-F family ATP-binding cassette domain-containing protein [Oscillospiraceae bacterium]
MSLLTAQNLTFGFLDGVLFKGAAFKVEETDRIGLIGANGTGKTSLFKLITGEYSPGEGGIVRGKDVRVGYMEQYLQCDNNQTLYNEALTVFSDVAELEEKLELINEELLHNSSIDLIEKQIHLTEEIERRDGLVYKAKTKSSLIGLGFSENELNAPVKNLSGGQRSKLSLCKLLLSNANLLLLDEPTNNLDVDAITWLEDFLIKYKGAFIVVSHDRYFLDKITTSTMEIAHNKLTKTVGNYSIFQKLKAERELTIEREYEKTSAEIKRIEGIIEQQKRFNQERNYITIASKEKQIERLKETLVLPDKALKSVHFSFKTELRAGDEVLCVENLCKSFPQKPLFENFNLNIYRDDRIFLLGPNGCGKSTFLKILNKEATADSGMVRFGSNVKIGYFDQNIDKLHSEKTVLDEVWDMYRFMTETEIRNALAMFLFTGDDVYKEVSLLSGGERAKISLLKIMLSKPNFLILDEPTNHLDIVSREVLENALLEFNGTLLVVSHDRYFINKLATKTVYLTHDKAVNIDGNYDNYLEYKLNEELKVNTSEKKTVVNDYKLRKEKASNERKRKTRLVKVEEEITSIENKISDLESALTTTEISSDYEKLLECTNELNSLHQQLDNLYIEWEELQNNE